MDPSTQLREVEQLKKNLEVDIENLRENFEQLKLAQGKFQESAVALVSLSAATESRQILVPMTSSLYVPGVLAAGSQVLVDVGTNFIVGKSPKDAHETFQKKIAYLKTSTETLVRIINDKRGDLGRLDSLSAQLQEVVGRK
jgi:prefoldin alpha subunit